MFRKLKLRSVGGKDMHAYKPVARRTELVSLGHCTPQLRSGMSRYVINEVTFVIFLSALKEKLKFRFDLVKWPIFIIFDLFFLPLPRVMMGVDGQMLLSEDCVNRRWPKLTVWASLLCLEWEWGYLVSIDWLIDLIDRLIDRSIKREEEEGSTKSHVVTIFILGFAYFALMQAYRSSWSSSDLS